MYVCISLSLALVAVAQIRMRQVGALDRSVGLVIYHQLIDVPDSRLYGSRVKQFVLLCAMRTSDVSPFLSSNS